MRVAEDWHDCRCIFGLLGGAGPLQHLRKASAMHVTQRDDPDALTVHAHTNMVANRTSRSTMSNVSRPRVNPLMIPCKGTDTRPSLLIYMGPRKQ